MSVFEHVFHKELNMINCFCGFMGLSHHCTRKIKGTIKIINYPTDWKVSEKEVDRKKYNSAHWTTDHDGYTACGTCYNKLGVDPICTGCFCGVCYSDLNEKCACIKD